MAFNTPKFREPSFSKNPPNPPLLATTSLTNILSTTKLDSQFERADKFRKVGQNAGFVDASFETMMKVVGWKGSLPWCAYYVKLVYMQLYSFDRDWLSKNIGGGAIDNLNIVSNLNKKGDKRYLAIFNDDQPLVGDVFCSGVSGNGHTGIIVEVLGQSGKGWNVKTIEGNTSDKAVREGYRTQYLTRTLQIGVKSGGQIMRGYWRRNFTETELADIIYDESQGTYVKKGATINNPKGWESNPLNPMNIMKNK
jgi:hypothetical protein